MEIKGKHFRAEVPKALKNIEHQKCSASVSSGGSGPFMTGMLSSEGQACISSETRRLNLMHIKSSAGTQENLWGKKFPSISQKLLNPSIIYGYEGKGLGLLGTDLSALWLL